MQIKEKSEDARLAALNRPIDLTAETKQAEQLNPIARLKPVEERQERRPRKSGDRRQGERRKENRKVLLDTRANRERRRGPRRTDEREQGGQATAEQMPNGIDVEC